MGSEVRAKADVAGFYFEQARAQGAIADTAIEIAFKLPWQQ
jgi:hypothetical protein